MTREEKIELLNRLLEIEEKDDIGNLTRAERREFQQWVNDAFEPCEDATLKDIFCMGCEYKEQEPCDDAVSREAVLECFTWTNDKADIWNRIKELSPVTPQPKTGHCKDCKQWKDSDGVYRRGVGAESQCPINCKEVFEGDGYCFLFKPQESEGKG